MEEVNKPEYSKTQLLILPFFLISIGITVIYSLFNWLFIIKLEAISLNKEIIEFFIPLALPWIPLLIWLNPGIKLLKLQSKRGDRFFAYLMIAWILMITPCIVMQSYISTAAGKLNTLEKVSQIDSLAKTKYYSLKKFFVDKSQVCVKRIRSISGKNDQYLNYNVYLVCPIMDDSIQRRPIDFKAWLALNYSMQVNNDSRPTAEKDTESLHFYRETLKNFEQKDLTKFSYLERMGNIKSEELNGYEEALKASDQYNGKVIDYILCPQEGTYESRNGSKLEWAIGTFVAGLAIWGLMISLTPFNFEVIEQRKKGKVAKSNDAKDFMDFIIPHKGFFTTPIIAGLNIFIFILMVCLGTGIIDISPEDLINWGANFKPLSLDSHEWWRLFTSMFLHGGIMHLLLNMYGLIFVGIFLEPIIGDKRFAIIYVITGLISSIASVYWHTEAVVSVGASGAIFGMYGFWLALLSTGRFFPAKQNKAILTNVLAFVGLNLVMGLKGSVDNAAHIGGLLSGLLLGYCMFPFLPRIVIVKEGEVEELTNI